MKVVLNTLVEERELRKPDPIGVTTINDSTTQSHWWERELPNVTPELRIRGAWISVR